MQIVSHHILFYKRSIRQCHCFYLAFITFLIMNMQVSKAVAVYVAEMDKDGFIRSYASCLYKMIVFYSQVMISL